ncbi:hypothetical protein EV702DRAFT_1194993 [Suillus placidus]|uniref:Fungal-type protein kinase domain-containing protein n=1 Tax=Suillus placidus TaxID=48579 RepID=A0A9P6ZZU8_9AGAM|nr:hypothetical protein EV702DRAFT_1194993 [Suillus placidus]
MSPAGDTGTSSTPPRANAAAPVVSKIESTPNSRGAAVVSEHISLVGVNVDQIRPWIQRDIQETKECKADVMLQALLQRASCDKETEQPHLLQKCLKAVLPVCNGQVACTNNDVDLHSSGIKIALDTYVGPGKEEKFYSPFITATNIALACLREIKVDGMPVAASAVDMICQKNDFPIFQSHQKEKSTRKPDLVFLPLKTLGDKVDADHRVKDATTKPKDRVLWKDVLACIEFKRKSPKGRTEGVDLPPTSHKVKNYVPTKPEYLPLPVNHPKPDDQAPAPAPGLSQTATQPASEPALVPGSDYDSGQPSQGPSSSKRKAKGQLGSEAKRPKPGDKDPPDVTVQTGLYAAEMFAANLAVNHVLNLIVVDDVIWIWYYDRQGIIQSSGINFIQDLPRFMVLLYALQRFDLHDWGRNKRFLPVQHGKNQCHEITIEDADLGPVDLLLHTSNDARVTHYGLQGRATNVVPVTRWDGCQDLLGEETRTSEPEILEKVKEIAKVHQSVEGHIPVLLCHQRFTNPTSSIRKALGFLEPTKGSRVLYILVFPKLSPITKLHGDELFNARRQCILCHFILWKAGVYHRDVSPGNMMWYRDKLGKLMGVLNDYDLSSLANVPGPQGNERTGTVPFMALDLLTAKAQQGEVKHLYRHDLESFMWVFIWICLRYRKGVLLPPASRPFDEWATSGATTCRMHKLDFLDSLGEVYRLGIKRRMWRFLVQCVRVLKKDHDRRSDLRLDQLIGAVDQSDDDEDDEDEDEDDDDADDEESVDELDSELPGAVEQSDEESESAIDGFLRMFTGTKGWVKLERRILSR